MSEMRRDEFLIENEENEVLANEVLAGIMADSYLRELRTKSILVILVVMCLLVAFWGRFGKWAEQQITTIETEAEVLPTGE